MGQPLAPDNQSPTRRSLGTMRQVAIFYVYTSKEVAWDRCNFRALKTGRAVPEDLFLDSLKSPDSVLRKLTPKVTVAVGRTPWEPLGVEPMARAASHFVQPPCAH